MKKNLFFGVVSALLVFTFLLVPVRYAAEASGKDIIKIGIYAEPTGLDPQNAEDTNSQCVHKNITETLVKLDDHMKYIPGLAEKWDVSKDGLTYKFTLRKGVKAHNGDSLKAEDVKFTFERGAKSPKVEKAFRSIKSIDTPDEHTVILHLKYVSPVTLGYLSSPSTGIVCKRAVQEKGDAAFNKSPIGYGPYKFKSWKSGANVVLEAFDGYYGKKPAIKEAMFVIMPDPSTAAIALKKGEIDLLPQVSTTDVKDLEKTSGIKVYKGPSLIGTNFHMNTQRKPFDNVLVRQAINYAVDKQAVIDAALDGIGGKIMQSYIPDLSLNKKSGTIAYPYDPEKAKALLRKAGLKDGFTFTISTNQGVNEKIAQIIQASLANIGITVKIDVIEWGSLLALTANGKYDSTIMRIVAMIPDPDLSLYTRFHSTEANNYSRYKDKKLDQMLDEARVCPNPKVRTDEYIKIGEYLKEQAPTVPLFYKEIIDASSKNLKGYKTDPRNFISLEKLSW